LIVIILLHSMITGGSNAAETYEKERSGSIGRIAIFDTDLANMALVCGRFFGNLNLLSREEAAIAVLANMSILISF